MQEPLNGLQGPRCLYTGRIAVVVVWEQTLTPPVKYIRHVRGTGVLPQTLVLKILRALKILLIFISRRCCDVGRTLGGMLASRQLRSACTHAPRSVCVCIDIEQPRHT